MATCREIESVTKSANPDKNTLMGGHLTQHIYGMSPPPGKSQLGKTLFEKRTDFEAMWRFYSRYNLPCNCAGKQAQQQLAVETLGRKYLGAYSCTAVDETGRCTAFDAYMASEVFFGFLFVDKAWILNTCFPVPLV